MKLVLGMEVGLSPSDFVLHGDPVLFPQKGAEPPPNFRPISIVAKRLDASRCHLVLMLVTSQGTFVLDGDPVPVPKKGVEPSPQFSAHFYCGQTAGCIKMPLGMEIASAHATVLDGDPDPYPKRGGAPPSFRPTSIVAKRLHGSRCHLVRR